MSRLESSRAASNKRPKGKPKQQYDYVCSFGNDPIENHINTKIKHIKQPENISISTAITRPHKKFDDLTADFESNSSKGKEFSIETLMNTKRMIDKDCVIPPTVDEDPDMKEFDKDRLMQKMIAKKHEEMQSPEPIINSKSQKTLKVSGQA